VQLQRIGIAVLDSGGGGPCVWGARLPSLHLSAVRCFAVPRRAAWGRGSAGPSRAAALRPNGHTFSLILGILGRAGRVREAEEVFAVFRGMGFRDKVHGFNAMLAAYMRQGQGAKAWAMFEEMMRAPTAPLMHGPRRDSMRSQGEGQPLAEDVSGDSAGAQTATREGLVQAPLMPRRGKGRPCGRRPRCACHGVRCTGWGPCRAAGGSSGPGCRQGGEP